MKLKSIKNKTIIVKDTDFKKYKNKIINIDKDCSISDVLNKTIQGDTFCVLDFLPKKSVDLLFVDPPYNLTRNFNGNTFYIKSIEDYENYTRKWVNKIFPLLKETASIYVCCDWKTSLIIEKVLNELFFIRNRITWKRNKGRGSSKNYKNDMEDIWFSTVSKNYTFNIEDIKVRKKVITKYRDKNGNPKDWEETKNDCYRYTYPSNIWEDITIPFWNMFENTEHPTQKPEKLLAKIILASSNKGDLILDPFLGSGTTSVVAKKLQRNYIGIESNEEYCILTEKRLDIANKDNYIQGYENGAFLDRNYK